MCPKTCRHIARRVHDEWLIMKLCMYVGYHDANNVSNFGGDPMTQRLKNLICHFVFQNMRSAGYHENIIGRTYFGGDQVTQLNLVLYNAIKWPYQPKHSPSCEGTWYLKMKDGNLFFLAYPGIASLYYSSCVHFYLYG